MTKKRSDQPYNDLCQFPFSDGRLCRMLRHPRHPNLCPFHAQAELQLLESRSLGAEISATLTGHFITSADVVHILGKVFTALAQDRIPQKKAATLAYLGQTMLHSMPQVARETDIAFTYDNWLKLLDRSVYPADSRVRPDLGWTRAAATAAPPPSAPPAAPPPVAETPSPEGAAATPPSTTPPPQNGATQSRPAGVTMPPSARATTPLTPSESALPQKPPLSPVESALPKQTT